jgi:hypothetical protein
MKRAVSLAITLILVAVASLLAGLWRIRAALPYSEAGRFYDSAESVVYTESAVFAYGMLALVFTAMALMSALLTVHIWRR